MKPRKAPRGRISLALSFCVLAIGAVSVQAGTKQRPGPTPPTDPLRVVEVVDGTPRPFHGPVVQPATVASKGRTESLSLLPPDDPLASLQTITDEAGMASPLGGDDIIVATSTGDFVFTSLQVASDGTAYIAVMTLGNFHVLRSVDGGETWTLWTTLTGVTAPHDFLIAEGTLDRAIVAYQYGGIADHPARIAYADLNAAVPTWTVVTALATAGVDHGWNIDIETDAVDYASYYVYLVARSSDGNGDDLWFTRSTNQGTSFAAGYRVASKSTGVADWYGAPMLGYGDGDYIHLSYTDGSDTSDPGCLQRRVPSFASGGLPAWESPITLDSRGNGVSAWNLAMEPSTTSGNVTVLMHVPGPDVESRYSTDFGATYPGGNFGFVLNNVPASSAQLLNRASGNLVLVTALNASPPDPSSIFVTRSHVGDPGTWSVPEEFSTHESYGVAFTRIAFDPTRGDRYAVAWADARGSGDYLLRFDAEWRRDPGYPNTDIGFPLAIPGGQTPPAVAEVDGDAEKEIVFGTLDGNVWVVNHDGIVAPGWPVDIGTLPVDAPVAVADLVGNGEFTVVSGTANGQVYAIDPDGNVLPGWPYNMGTGAPVFVSIGALGPPRLHYVVAVSGTKMALIDYWGENFAPAWANIPFGVHMNSAAIGDVDNDGVSEIITAAGPNIYKHRMDNAAFSGLQFPGETFSDSPTLADINGDNKLEIAAPTTSGKMYLLTHELANYSAAWPITVSPGTALTGAAFGQILGTSEPELVFAEAGGLVHVRYSTGVEQAGYPIASGSGVLYMPPMLATVNVSSSNVNIGTTIAVVDGRAHSWRNVPSAGVPGWPRNLPGPVEETFASGDIDNDGRNELVVLGVDFLSVYDVGIAPQSTARNHWPMYGYDAQRTGCLACVEPMSAVGDAPAAPGHATLDVHPNPFNPVATITYEVKLSGPVTLAVYDVGGRLVETLIDGEVRAANRYSISYRANVASGVYFLRLTTGGEEVATKMVLLK